MQRSSDIAHTVLSHAAAARFVEPLQSVSHELAHTRHELNKVLSRTSDVPECRHTSTPLLRDYCLRWLREPGDELAERRITVAATECYLSAISHIRVQSCQEVPDQHLTQCIKNSNQNDQVSHIHEAREIISCESAVDVSGCVPPCVCLCPVSERLHSILPTDC